MAAVTFMEFCKRYDLDPESQEAIEDWDEYCKNLVILREVASDKENEQ